MKKHVVMNPKIRGVVLQMRISYLGFTVTSFDLNRKRRPLP